MAPCRPVKEGRGGSPLSTPPSSRRPAVSCPRRCVRIAIAGHTKVGNVPQATLETLLTAGMERAHVCFPGHLGVIVMRNVVLLLLFCLTACCFLGDEWTWLTVCLLVQPASSTTSLCRSVLPAVSVVIQS